MIKRLTEGYPHGCMAGIFYRKSKVRIMSRKLASIQRIWKIEPIEGADRIELAYVLGWQCVVNKGQFKPMDLAVYFEI